MKHPRHLSVDELDSLLSRGRFSGPAKDRVLNAVLQHSANPTWFMHSWLQHGVPRWAFASAALAVVLVAVALWGVWSPAPPAQGEWEARGVQAPAGPQVEASCVGPCKVGSVLVLRVQGVSEAAYVAAYAVGADGQRIWYFPSDNGTMPRVQATQVTPLRQGVRLGTEHAVGAYTLHTLLLRAPLSRDEILKLDDAPRPDVVLAQVNGKVEIAP